MGRGNKNIFPAVTNEQRIAIAQGLRGLGGVWVDTPEYGKRDRAQSLQNLEDVYKTITEIVHPDATTLENAYEQSRRFVHAGFDGIEAKGTNIMGREVQRAFVVPMRASRFDDERLKNADGNSDNSSNASESVPFVPLLDPKFGVGSDARMRAMYGYPPTVLDTYFKDPEHSGVLVLAPIYADMTGDINPGGTKNIAELIKLHETVQKATRETAEFVYHKIGGRAIGLGAILPHPKITNYGNTFRGIKGMENIVTTTGHAGTVHMIAETIHKIRKETSIETDGKIGVIGGAGSIGWSTTATILEIMKDHKVLSYDKDEEKLLDQVFGYNHSDRIELESNVLEVLRNTNIIVSAVTTRIDLDELEKEFNHGEMLDLTGKVVIDDSQPGCFSKEQIEARNGRLVWVIGEDTSSTKFMSRDGLFGGKPYNYGDTSGVMGVHDDFPCGEELATIEYLAAFDKAIRGPVEPKNALALAGLMRAVGVRPAKFQAYGQPVHIA